MFFVVLFQIVMHAIFAASLLLICISALVFLYIPIVYILLTNREARRKETSNSVSMVASLKRILSRKLTLTFSTTSEGSQDQRSNFFKKKFSIFTRKFSIFNKRRSTVRPSEDRFAMKSSTESLKEEEEDQVEDITNLSKMKKRRSTVSFASVEQR